MKRPYEVYRVSVLNGKANTLSLTFDMDDFLDWKSGRKLIQNALPYLNANEREFLMTGITAAERDDFFKD